jgi:hypothetical protein
VREGLRDFGPTLEWLDPTPADERITIHDHTVVVFVGGCTLDEVAQLRRLGKREQRQYLIITTGIVTAPSMGHMMANLHKL